MPPPKKQPPKEPQDYKQLRALWYAKLKENGYDDIEQTDGNLKVWAVKFNSKPLQELWRRNEPYYTLARRFLAEYEFEKKADRHIWEYHSNGISIRDMIEVLAKVKIKIGRQQIWLTIKRLETAMKAMYLSRSTDNNE